MWRAQLVLVLSGVSQPVAAIAPQLSTSHPSAAIVLRSARPVSQEATVQAPITHAPIAPAGAQAAPLAVVDATLNLGFGFNSGRVS